MTVSKSCPQCGRDLPTDAPSGVCPQCLLGVGMQATATAEVHAARANFRPPKPHELGPHFPQLEILDLVGQGGMGAVYKARQRGLDRLVALKILPPEVAKDPSFEERFAREARALAKLNHANIVGVYDSGNAGGLFYVLMEYVDGVNLRDAIQTGELTPEEALGIVPQICEALQYAHDEGVVHRDIKPENILLDKKGAVKIADFGLARLLGQAPDNFTLTGTHQVMGTPKYMAPEQMEGSHEVDHRADIFSLGVVFYEMLTGELPLGRFDAPSKKVKLDVRLDEIVLRTLEKEPDRRYQTASQIKADVETIHGFANAPPHIQQRYGYEYRSQAEILGLPLVHICQGVDPHTGKKRIAKGVIAVGDVAVGGLAFGGVACGGVTFGGLSVGLISIGGLALGLLMAMGGGAIGTGISFGGLAIGTFAVGGGAFGIWGVGQQGAIAKPIGPPDDVIQTLVVILMLVMIVIVVSVSIVTAIARRHARASHEPTISLPKDAYHNRGSSQTGCILTALLLLLCLACVIPGMLMWSYTRVHHSRLVAERVRAEHQIAQVYSEARERQRAEEKAATKFNAGRWTLTEQGPKLTSTGETHFDLTTDQVSKVNEALQSVYRDYLEVEQRHTTQSVDKLGHVLTIIEPFKAAEIAELEQKLWSQLDAILTLDQQTTMRRELAVHAAEGARRSDEDLWKPGILGWGRYGCQIEVWRVGTWYHWKAKIKVSNSRTYVPNDEAPELLDLFRRFWPENVPNEEADGQS